MGSFTLSILEAPEVWQALNFRGKKTFSNLACISFPATYFCWGMEICVEEKERKLLLASKGWVRMR